MRTNRKTVLVTISIDKEALDIVNKLASESGLNRSRFINKTILETTPENILQIEYKTQKQLEICMAIYDIQRENFPTHFRMVDNGEIQKIDVSCISVEFIIQVINTIQKYSKVISIKLIYRAPETPTIN